MARYKTGSAGQNGTATATLLETENHQTEPGDPYLYHQVDIKAGHGYTAGTITITAKKPGENSPAQTVYESDGTTAMTINLAAIETKLIGPCQLSEIIGAGSGMSGGSLGGWTMEVRSIQRI